MLQESAFFWPQTRLEQLRLGEYSIIFFESPYDSVELRDYYHACRQSDVTQSGEILVFPSGCLNDDYLGKLARVDFEPPLEDAASPLAQLLHQVRNELQPDWILLDTGHRSF